MKKTISFLLTLVLLLSLFTGSARAEEERILCHVHDTSPYVTLDPSVEYSNGIMVLQNVYETLTHYDPETGKAEPLLAKSWKSSRDGTVWVFQLRDDVRFHDGSLLTAQQVVNSFRRTMELGEGAAYIWDAVLPEKGGSIEATDEYEVTIQCGYPCAMDLIVSSAYAAYVMSDSVLDKDAAWFDAGHDGGSGPYYIAEATGDSVLLLSFAEYRDGWTEAQYPAVRIREVAGSGERRRMLESGEAQIGCDFSPADLAVLQAQQDSFTAITASTFNTAILFVNTAVEPGSNVDFRRALAYAFPYEETVSDILNGCAVPSVGTVPAGLWGHSDDLFRYQTDLETARDYLARSGVDTTGLTLTATYLSGDESYEAMLRLYQANLGALGIRLELEALPWEEQWARAQAPEPEERQDLFLCVWWPDYADPASWFISLLHSEDEIQYNLSYVRSKSLDTLIDEAAELSVSFRAAAEADYLKVQEILADQAYYLNLYDQLHCYIVSNSVAGVAENPAYAYAIDYYHVTAQ